MKKLLLLSLMVCALSSCSIFSVITKQCNFGGKLQVDCSKQTFNLSASADCKDLKIPKWALKQAARFNIEIDTCAVIAQ